MTSVHESVVGNRAIQVGVVVATVFGAVAGAPTIWSLVTSDGSEMPGIATSDIGTTLPGAETSDETRSISGGRIDEPWEGVSDGSHYRGDRLQQGESLRPGDYIASDNLMAMLHMEHDGNVILAVNERMVWETGTGGRGATQMELQDDGNLVVQASDGRAIWDPRDLPSDQDRAGHAAYLAATPTWQLVIGGDGNLVAFNSQDQAEGGSWWQSGTDGTFAQPTNTGDANLAVGEELLVGEYIRNLDTETPHAMVLQGDGNLVIHGPGRSYVWDSDTDTLDVMRLVVAHDGDVLFESADGEVIARTATDGHPDAFLRLGDDGNLVVYDREPGSDRAIWSRVRDELVRPG